MKAVSTYATAFLALCIIFSLSGCAAVAPGAVLPRSSSAQAAAEADCRPRTVSVTGDAEVRVVPDEVILTLGIQTKDDDLATAKRMNDEAVRRVLAVTKELGIEAKLVQTDFISIEPRYRDDYEEQQFLGYFARKTVDITLRDTGKFEDLLSKVLGSGANYVHGINFRTTELRKYRDQARALAIKAAREKARALAGELGQEVGEPLAIREEYSGWWSSYNSWWGSRWGGSVAQNVIQNAAGDGSFQGDDTLAPGQIAVRAQVSVEFALK